MTKSESDDHQLFSAAVELQTTMDTKMVCKTKRVSKWYMGGVSSMAAACFTHPLDLLKVHLQTQQELRLGMRQMATKVVQSEGFIGLYNGISASLLRQGTYSMTRFALYETGKARISSDGAALSFYQMVLLAGASGFCGGVVGTPGDLVNVRMQNDMKLPPELRRNYKHALDGLWRVYSEEGLRGLFSGCFMASSRAVVITIGQLSVYDKLKVNSMISWMRN
jgi:dicarboxylate transporter 10